MVRSDEAEMTESEAAKKETARISTQRREIHEGRRTSLIEVAEHEIVDPVGLKGRGKEGRERKT